MLANCKTLLNQVKQQIQSDVSLVRAYSRGDASAFDALYSRYKDRLFSSLFHQLGSNQQAAEEVAQETWMAVIKGAASFEDGDDTTSDNSKKGSTSFQRWLFSIAHRRVADYWRRQYRNQEAEPLEEDELSLEADAGLTRESSEQESQQLVHELRQFLMELPEDQRQSFVLQQEGFSYQEIADISSTGIETVKSRLRYAKNTLKQRLGGEYE